MGGNGIEWMLSLSVNCEKKRNDYQALMYFVFPFTECLLRSSKLSVYFKFNYYMQAIFSYAELFFYCK